MTSCRLQGRDLREPNPSTRNYLCSSKNIDAYLSHVFHILHVFLVKLEPLRFHGSEVGSE